MGHDDATRLSWFVLFSPPYSVHEAMTRLIDLATLISIDGSTVHRASRTHEAETKPESTFNENQGQFLYFPKAALGLSGWFDNHV